MPPLFFTMRTREHCSRKGEKGMRKCKAILAGILTAACILAGCGAAREEQQAPAKTETVSSMQETAAEAAGTEERAAEAETAGTEEEATAETAGQEEETAAAETAASEDGTAAAEGAEDESGAAGTYAYHLETKTQSWNDSAGQEACSVSLEYPVFEGALPAETAINVFYQEWVSDKLDAWETGENPLVTEAVEIRESGADIEGMPPFSDEYSVTDVAMTQGVISILQENYLYTGGAHGMPGRENHIFSGTDGKEVTLLDVLPISEEEVNALVKEQFLTRIEEHPEDGFFPEAADTVNATTDFISQSYLTQDGVVFYAQPYELGPYAAGYIEVSLTWEQLGM